MEHFAGLSKGNSTRVTYYQRMHAVSSAAVDVRSLCIRQQQLTVNQDIPSQQSHLLPRADTMHASTAKFKVCNCNCEGFILQAGVCNGTCQLCHASTGSLIAPLMDSNLQTRDTNW